MFDWIAFDADDTLWKNEEYYREGRLRFQEILSRYGAALDDSVEVDRVESENIEYYGYGVMSFVLSLIEMGIRETRGALKAKDVQELLDLGKEMLSKKIQLMQGTKQVLDELQGQAQLLLITKGDLNHQLKKVKESGLKDYFQVVKVVNEKSPETYSEILKEYQISPDQFVMVGNSIRSDVKPVLAIGGFAVHLAGHLSWSHEDDQLEEEYQNRFRSVSGLSDVPGALESLIRADN
jgi:putative hydrolase of the HAD superfamily